MDKCPSDFISFVKICVFIQWLELILKRSDPTEKETYVDQYRTLEVQIKVPFQIRSTVT